MKKVIFYIIIIAFWAVFSAFSSHGVFASDNTDYDTIEEEQIDELIIDPAKEVPENLLMPKPTPSPAKEEKIEDKRSWTKSEFKEIIQETALKYDLDPQLIYATIMTESEGNPLAFRYEPSIKDASLGLGQVLINTARRLGFEGEPKELYEPEVAIDLIGKYHRKTLDEYGELSPEQLTIAYNAGSPYSKPVPGHILRFNKWYKENEG